MVNLPWFKSDGARTFAGAAVLLTIVVAGCKAPGNAKTVASSPAAPAPAAGPANRYRVTAASTSFFRLGPQQPKGPDLALKQGSRVTLVRRGFGYSQVQLEDGTSGFVGTEDIAKLTPEETAAEFKPLLPAANGPAANGPAANNTPAKLAAARRRSRAGAPNIPIAPPDEPGLPAAADPTPRSGPVPTFRY